MRKVGGRKLDRSCLASAESEFCAGKAEVEELRCSAVCWCQSTSVVEPVRDVEFSLWLFKFVRLLELVEGGVVLLNSSHLVVLFRCCCGCVISLEL